MFRRILAALGTAVAAIAATLVVASPASAAQTDQSALPRVALVLSVASTHNDGSPAATTVGSLLCEPTGGRHRNPVGACAELLGAAGDVQATDHPMTGACPLHVAPVTVRAFGWYGDRLVDHTYSYSNSCFFVSSASQLWNI